MVVVLQRLPLYAGQTLLFSAHLQTSVLKPFLRHYIESEARGSLHINKRGAQPPSLRVVSISRAGSYHAGLNLGRVISSVTSSKTTSTDIPILTLSVVGSSITRLVGIRAPSSTSTRATT